jgi:hypothetical protein
MKGLFWGAGKLIKDIDFTNAKIDKLRMYGGSNGSKIGIIYQEEKYMLKFPPRPALTTEMSYTKRCISEYVACNIFQTLGIDAQQTLLGRYNDKIVVACKDFETDGFILRDFAQLKNTIIDSSHNGYGTELDDILETIQKQQLISPVELESAFWNMFAADTLLGNFDRHNGNWGFLINNASGEVKIAPIYDCGSCLYPQISENMMKHIIDNREEINKRLFVYPTSALHQGGKKVNYYQFLSTTEINESIEALKRVNETIDLAKINAVIENTPYISDIYKQFLQTMIKERKECIIDKALEHIQNRNLSMEKHTSQAIEVNRLSKTPVNRDA